MSEEPSGRPIGRLMRAPYGRQIADDLRQRILYGEIRGGTRLVQQEICAQYGTSRMPVRDALKELQLQGFIHDDGNRRPVVVPLKANDLLDAFTIEAHIHGLAARRVAELEHGDGFADLERLHTLMLTAAKEGNLQSLSGLNWGFHRTVNRLANSPKLMVALRSLSVHMPKDYLSKFAGAGERSNKEHAQLLEAFRAKDGEAAFNIAYAHVLEPGRDFLGFLREKGVC